jgi:hypothetical protein
MVKNMSLWYLFPMPRIRDTENTAVITMTLPPTLKKDLERIAKLNGTSVRWLVRRYLAVAASVASNPTLDDLVTIRFGNDLQLLKRVAELRNMSPEGLAHGYAVAGLTFDLVKLGEHPTLTPQETPRA